MEEQNHSVFNQIRHPLQTIQNVMQLGKSGEMKFRSYPMLALHTFLIVASLVLTIPISIALMSGAIAYDQSFALVTRNILLSAVIPPAGIGLSIIAFEIYCRKVQKTHAYYRTYGQLVSIRELCEWVAPKMLDYFTKWDDREGTSRRDQWYIQNLAHGEKAVESHAARASGRNRLIVLTKHMRTPDDEETIHQEMLAVPIGATEDAAWMGARYRASAMSIPSVTREFTAAMSLGSSGLTEMSTGEGGLYPDYHLAGGDDVRLEFQIGTGYFGCRDTEGGFSLSALLSTLDDYPQIFGIQIKLSQGAKQDGGKCLANKVDPETAAVRGIEPFTDSFTDPVHHAFSDPEGLAHFIALIRKRTGKVVGIKMAVGSTREIAAFCQAFEANPDGIPDTIQVCYGDGTGAAYAEAIESTGRKDISALQIFDILLRKHGIRHRVKLIASGRNFKPNDCLRAFVLGADICATGRGFKYAAGCGGIRRCHQGHECISGVAGNGFALDPIEKGERIRTWLEAMIERTAHIIAQTGVSSIEELIGTRDKYVVLDDVKIWTPEDVEAQLTREFSDFRTAVDRFYQEPA